MLIDEQIIKDLTKISEEFKQKLLTIIKQGGKLDKIELAKLVAEIDFWKDLDLETQTKLKLTELFDKYDGQITNIMKLADAQKVRDAVSINKDILETLKYFRGEELLGRAKVFSDQLKNTLLSSIITGKTFNQVKEDLANIPLTSPQLNTVISTGYNDYGRNLLALTYEKYPEQRFLYYGTIIPTSSKQCTWLLMNQDMSGGDIAYHGTSSKPFEKFMGDVAYFTKDPKEAESFATNPIIGGGRGKFKPRVIKVVMPKGKTKGIDSLVQEEIMDGGDLDTLIEEQASIAREEGFEFLSFEHPSTIEGQDYFTAIIALNPSKIKQVNSEVPIIGYTMAEINAGINTPYGVINWNGRIPNFNCDDMWLPVTETLIKSIKAFQERNRALAMKVLSK